MKEEEPILLKPFALTKANYFDVLWSFRTGGAGWFYVTLFLLGLFLIFGNAGSVYILLVGFLFVVMPVRLIVLLYRYVNLKSNRTAYEERHIEMTATGMSVIMDGGARSFVPWSYVFRCTDLKRYYILHLNEGMFIPVDKSAFQSHIDEQRFRSWLTASTPR
ncbi:MAG: YcxB family protein [Flavobacteriales bacterium]|nr:YcxB family protein [Flavobacteriales bacterium]